MDIEVGRSFTSSSDDIGFFTAMLFLDHGDITPMTITVPFWNSPTYCFAMLLCIVAQGLATHRLQWHMVHLSHVPVSPGREAGVCWQRTGRAGHGDVG